MVPIPSSTIIDLIWSAASIRRIRRDLRPISGISTDCLRFPRPAFSRSTNRRVPLFIQYSIKIMIDEIQFRLIR